MNLEIALNSDNDSLLNFYRDFPIKGLVDLRVDRHQDYFGVYKIQSDQNRTYILRDDDGKILATASFIFRELQLENRLHHVAYATDLRVSPSRKAILEWSHHFLPVMKAVTEEFNISHFFSYINMTDPSEMNLFIRPRTMRRPLPRYFLFRRFNLVSLHGKFPWAPAPLKHVRIRPCNEANKDALLAYIIKRSQYRMFYSVWDMASLIRKISRLPGFKWQDFLIAFDSEDNIIGCVAPWRGNQVQDLIPQSYSLRAHNFRQFLKFGKVLGWTRNLSKPIRSTGQESPLKFQYLTNLFVDNEDIFECLLTHAFENAERDEFLLYSQVEKDIRISAPESWISAEVPMGLYAVVPPGEVIPDFLHPAISYNPEIDPCFVL
jgi:hypothetical protein